MYKKTSVSRYQHVADQIIYPIKHHKLANYRRNNALYSHSSQQMVSNKHLSGLPKPLSHREIDAPGSESGGPLRTIHQLTDPTGLASVIPEAYSHLLNTLSRHPPATSHHQLPLLGNRDRSMTLVTTAPAVVTTITGTSV